MGSTCTGFEAAGNAIISDADGKYVNTIFASRCFLEWWCPANGYTWTWRDGIDPDDPSTWPLEPEPPSAPDEQ